ncbi:OsmC family protein [Oligoflexus tunisiensis]|uniref:OsmC family protein n=1 Tax=Oligoflexus tunisiensis TaxID=708132 RepID=UPI000AA65780|nr:OsmC family protein [Oligoflexus tunisiensis]
MANIRNGVNLDNINALVEGVKSNPKLANVTFVANSKWKNGTKTEVTIGELLADGKNIRPSGKSFKLMVDEPKELGGNDEYPNPVEYLAAGLAGCITAGIATNGALFGTDFTEINVKVEVNFDLHGVLGLDKSKPNGALDIRYQVELAGAASPEKLTKAKETIDRKSPVKNTLEGQLPVRTSVKVKKTAA